MKSLKYIVALALAAGLFQACDLERYPLTDLSEETFWNSESNAKLIQTVVIILFCQLIHLV